MDDGVDESTTDQLKKIKGEFPAKKYLTGRDIRGEESVIKYIS